MKLYFHNSHSERRLIGEPKNDKECWSIIHNFCSERNFTIPYVRSWTTENGEKYFDCGSWSEYFVQVNEL